VPIGAVATWPFGRAPAAGGRTRQEFPLNGGYLI
jgi:hypothetical protein